MEEKAKKAVDEIVEYIDNGCGDGKQIAVVALDVVNQYISDWKIKNLIREVADQLEDLRDEA